MPARSKPHDQHLQPFGVSLTKAELSLLKEIATLRGVSTSQIAREALQAYIWINTPNREQVHA